MNDSDVDGLVAAGAIFGVFGILMFLAFLAITIFFILTLNKLIDATRDEDLLQTHINKVWTWTMLIPMWGFIAFIVFNIKMDTSIRALETHLKQPFKSISYPSVLGWIYGLGILYSWIPLLGFLVLIISFIVYWVQVSSTTKQVVALKASLNN